jgi:hypothetical protein
LGPERGLLLLSDAITKITRSISGHSTYLVDLVIHNIK